MYLRLQEIRYSAYKNKICHLYHMIIQFSGSIAILFFKFCISSGLGYHPALAVEWAINGALVSILMEKITLPKKKKPNRIDLLCVHRFSPFPDRSEACCDPTACPSGFHQSFPQPPSCRSRLWPQQPGKQQGATSSVSAAVWAEGTAH